MADVDPPAAVAPLLMIAAPADGYCDPRSGTCAPPPTAEKAPTDGTPTPPQAEQISEQDA